MSSTTKNMDNRVEMTLTVPIIIGTYAIMFSQQEIARRRSRNDSSTHKWYCAIRSPKNDDMSYFIRKVVFYLHPTFLNPQRTIEKPPYEISEIGWGEFDIAAKVYFVDEEEKPVQLKHRLKLYPVGVEDFEKYRPPEGKQNCLATETYDELYFVNPRKNLYNVLMKGAVAPPCKYAMQEYFLKSHGKEEVLSLLGRAQDTISKSITQTKGKISQLSLELQKLKEIYYSINEDKAIEVIRSELPDLNEQDEKILAYAKRLIGSNQTT